MHLAAREWLKVLCVLGFCFLLFAFCFLLFAFCFLLFAFCFLLSYIFILHELTLDVNAFLR
ncbi:hypothetical protein B5L96_14445 [Klebsiella pneumoniae]|uniref:Uncharacterized protein n=1 Tax=Klebsiella pneumoniae TaxID=573 RepID=A0A202KTA2_KLEPN|nr:hypothetical protein B5L96_14445 [Klebsiella pneumoniae]